MAGLFSRMTSIFKAKASSALDKAEDPRQTLDYSYEKQLELLRRLGVTIPPGLNRGQASWMLAYKR